MQSFFPVGSVPDVLSAAIVFVLGLLFALAIGKKLRIGYPITVLLYFWHTLFCLVYAGYITKVGGDALGYYSASLHIHDAFAVGTDSVTYLVSFFSVGLGLSFLTVSLFFNIVGYTGLLIFYTTLCAATVNKSRLMHWLVLLVVLLPSISFWSAGIGKDAISFLAASMALWVAVDFRHRLNWMIPAVLLMVVVRPHMAGMLLIALSIALLARSRTSGLQKVFYGAIVIAATATVVPFALHYAGLEHFDAAGLSHYIQDRQGYNQEGGGGVDISAMSTPVQLVTYLFRPLPFEAKSIPQFAASIDNMVLLFLFIAGGYSMCKKRKGIVGADRLFLWIYALLAWVILAKTIANLGIAVRQKWMFTPMLIFLCISIMGKKRRIGSTSWTQSNEEFNATSKSLQ